MNNTLRTSIILCAIFMVMGLSITIMLVIISYGFENGQSNAAVEFCYKNGGVVIGFFFGSSISLLQRCIDSKSRESVWLGSMTLGGIVTITIILVFGYMKFAPMPDAESPDPIWAAVSEWNQTIIGFIFGSFFQLATNLVFKGKADEADEADEAESPQN